MYERFIAIANERTDEDMEQPARIAEKISDGLGYGHGPISGVEVTTEDRAALHEVITTDLAIVVPIDRDDSGKILDDDGCGDGREVRAGMIQRGSEFLRRSLHRSKVFGGALAMTVAARIGLGRAIEGDLNAEYDQAMAQLAERHIDFGAHTAEHHADNGCGCGAIDNSPQIIQAVATYELQIKDTIESLGVDTAGLDSVIDNFKAYGKSIDGAAYSGKRVMDGILHVGKVVKQLFGPHHERAIVLNLVEGYTMNQELIRQRTDGRAQAFAVDLWRVQQIAARSYDEQSDIQRAYLSELVYTLATAAVLTKGDLPVYLIKPAG